MLACVYRTVPEPSITYNEDAQHQGLAGQLGLDEGVRALGDVHQVDLQGVVARVHRVLRGPVDVHLPKNPLLAVHGDGALLVAVPEVHLPGAPLLLHVGRALEAIEHDAVALAKPSVAILVDVEVWGWAVGVRFRQSIVNEGRGTDRLLPPLLARHVSK